MGLGLSLIKSIVEKFNGKIWVEDKVLNDYTQVYRLIIQFYSSIIMDSKFISFDFWLFFIFIYQFLDLYRA